MDDLQSKDLILLLFVDFLSSFSVIISHRMIDPDIYFDIFNPTPFWNKAASAVEGMRKKRPHIYENFEMLNNKRLGWTKKARI